MNTLKRAFEKAKSENHLALIGYLPVSYSERQHFLSLVRSAIDAGLDILEIGVPTKNAIFDGQVIRTALEQAAAQGIRTKEALFLGAKAILGKNAAGIVMTYANTMLEYGPKKMIEDCSVLGIDGILAVGIGFDEWKTYAQLAKKYHSHLIGFLSPELSPSQIKEISNHAGGFLYLQSHNGPTGQQFNIDQELKSRITEIRKLTFKSSLPIVVGFGIRNQEDVMQIASYGADGVVIGTALVEAANEGRESVISLVNSLKEGTAFPLRRLK